MKIKILKVHLNAALIYSLVCTVGSIVALKILFPASFQLTLHALIWMPQVFCDECSTIPTLNIFGIISTGILLLLSILLWYWIFTAKNKFIFLKTTAVLIILMVFIFLFGLRIIYKCPDWLRRVSYIFVNNTNGDATIYDLQTKRTLSCTLFGNQVRDVPLCQQVTTGLQTMANFGSRTNDICFSDQNTDAAYSVSSGETGFISTIQVNNKRVDCQYSCTVIKRGK